jgi:hypothetical protein
MSHSTSIHIDYTQVARRDVWQSHLQLWKGNRSTSRVRGFIKCDVYTRTLPNKSQFRLHVPSLEIFQNSKDKNLWHKLLTMTDTAKQFLQLVRLEDFTVTSISVQMSTSHFSDVSTDPVLTSTDILALTETCMENDETVPLEGYKCITPFKRQTSEQEKIRPPLRQQPVFSWSWIKETCQRICLS